jgi:DNA mismatch repair protein MutS
VDAKLSIGLATAEHGWCYPTISEEGLTFLGLYHPLLKDGVQNDLVIRDTVRVCFITGPNMSGKSTLLRAVGIATMLAQSGCGVPAKAMSFAPNQALFPASASTTV